MSRGWELGPSVLKRQAVPLSLAAWLWGSRQVPVQGRNRLPEEGFQFLPLPGFLSQLSYQGDLCCTFTEWVWAVLAQGLHLPGSWQIWKRRDCILKTHIPDLRELGHISRIFILFFSLNCLICKMGTIDLLHGAVMGMKVYINKTFSMVSANRKY